MTKTKETPPKGQTQSAGAMSAEDRAKIKSLINYYGMEAFTRGIGGMFMTASIIWSDGKHHVAFSKAEDPHRILALITSAMEVNKITLAYIYTATAFDLNKRGEKAISDRLRELTDSIMREDTPGYE